MKNELVKTKSDRVFLSILKGIFLALVVSLIGILIFALIIKFFNIDRNLIQPINQVIKFLSILIGVRSMYKGLQKRNLLYSVILGIIYTVLCIFVFNLLNGSLNIDFSLFTDSLFGGIAGLISGVIAKVLIKD